MPIVAGMVSSITAAVPSVTAASIAGMSLKGTWLNPGGIAPNFSLNFASPVASASPVCPW